jgi:hypothetical protein
MSKKNYEEIIFTFEGKKKSFIIYDNDRYDFDQVTKAVEFEKIHPEWTREITETNK